MPEASVTHLINHTHFQVSYHLKLLKEPFHNISLQIIYSEQCLCCLWSFFQGQIKDEPQAKQNIMLIIQS